MSDRFPMMVYKDDAGEPLTDGTGVGYFIVTDEEELLIAKEDGWRESPDRPSPLDHDLDGLVGGSLPRRGRPPKLREVSNVA